jgi:hypothetical protein
MEENDEPAKPVFRKGTLVAEGGQPLRFTDVVEVANPTPNSSLSHAVAETLKTYRKAALALLDGKYASVRNLAPPHLRLPCHILVLCCPDGVLVRYDLAGEEKPKVRSADHPDRLTRVAPMFSEQVFHFPDDPQTYVLKQQGPGFVWGVTDASGNLLEERARIHPVIYASATLPVDFRIPAPPARPPCLASMHKELQIQMRGVALPANTPPNAIPPDVEHFVAHGVAPLPVGWQAIEIYPLLGEEHWQPQYAPMWAELDLLAAIAQRNAVDSALNRLDGRADARERYARVISEFEGLLAGPEEPAHQYLKNHPDLLCPTHDAVWSKMRFGEHVSDFIFREPCNDYLLVEIEAPHRGLFRKDGHPRHELEHSISQTRDWIRYIQDHKREVEEEQGLRGISPTPRTFVVIGRSASLSDQHRRALTAIEGERPKLSIMTYDDVIAKARANLERHFGPLSLRGENLKLYFYKEKPGSTVPQTQ